MTRNDSNPPFFLLQLNSTRICQFRQTCRREGEIMARNIAIGLQDFGKIRTKNAFYIDKTGFICEWWETLDDVTLITRPRRFGKTLTMSMVEHFFSVRYKNCDALFDGLNIWQDEKYRNLQGTFPVISISFSDIKETSYTQAKKKICETIVDLFNEYDFLAEGDLLNAKEKEYFHKISADMEDYEISISLKRLSNYLYQYYHQKVIILLDEYDTPMQEAFVGGYWDELAGFMRSLFNATFKNNTCMERALLTGITRISKESIFSDLNNMEVITTTSSKYASAFGFTEEEMLAALQEYDLLDQKEEVKYWYDGFVFGEKREIYNPWSIINYLDKKRVAPYWTNTSSNRLVGKLIQEGSGQLKESFEKLLTEENFITEIDEQIVYEQLNRNENAIWSLLLASGYLRVKSYKTEKGDYGTWRQLYELQITNFEVKIMFRDMVQGWFTASASNYNEFIRALLQGDLKAMNLYMNRVALATFSFFDSGKQPSEHSEPERFYHGFVLGLIVELAESYSITSNRESGFGRYDVLLEPKKPNTDAMILEFKVQDVSEEKDLSDTVFSALKQIDEKEYTAILINKGIPASRIRKYGFAFQGKTVLIGEGIQS